MRRLGRSVPLFVLFVVTSLTACVTAKRSDPAATTEMVDEETIAAMRVASAYDVVSRTHGEFLRGRGRISLDPKTPALPVHVYVDDTYYGDASTLRTIPASTLAQVRFYQGYEAQLKFGSGHLGGVIQVITKR